MEWITPKTDWHSESRMNAVDYNRIKNNLQVLAELVGEVYSSVNIEEMGADKDYTSWYYAGEFNRFENNLEVINQSVYRRDIGDKKTFFANGTFIDFEELNRIESALLYFYDRAEKQRKSMPRLSVRLGNVKGVQI